MNRETNHIPDANLPDTPYKGLEPYFESDAPFFFGRESEWKIIADNLMATRLTLLYGVSGVGKSSLLRAGVAYNLMLEAKNNLDEHGTPEFAVVVFNSWQDDPLAGLIEQVEKDVKGLLNGKIFAPLLSSRKLDQILEIWAERLDEKEDGELFIILDQFEEYFLYHSNEKGDRTFTTQFSHAVNCPNLPVNFLISIREDSLAKLDCFKASIPNLFNNLLRVKHLNAKSAYDAISKPVEVYNSLSTHTNKKKIELNEGLIKVVVDQVSQVVKGGNGLGITKASRDESERQIEAPYLQLVMEYLWKEEVEKKDSDSLSLQTLLDKGGAQKILSQHLNRQMKLLKEEEGEGSVVAVAKIFQYLVTPSGSKIAYPLQDLTEPTGLSENQLKKLLEKLASGKLRLLRAISKSSETYLERYEIFHDVLAQPILDWRKQYLLDEEKHRRNLAIMQGLPAQSLRQGKLGQDEKAALLARQAYCFYKQEPNKVLYQIDDALREALCIKNFSNILRGHQKGLFGVSAIAFNPKNPQILVSADGDGMIGLWDLHPQRDARQIRTFKHEHDGVDALAFSLDGKMLASGGYDGTVRLWWDLDKARISSRILGHHDKRVASVAFNWDGTILASSGDDQKIKIWNPENKSEDEPIATLRGHEGAVKTVAFSPHEKNGYLLASGSKDKRVRLWDIRDNSCLEVLPGHRDIVRSVAFSPDGQRLASGSDDRTVRLWDVSDLEHLDVEPERLEVPKNGVRSVAFSTDGQMLASGSEDQTVYLWKLNPLDKKPALLNLGHDFGISSVAFSPDNQILASGSWDKTIRLWHLRPSEAIPQILGEHDDNIMSVAVSPDGQWLASGSWDKIVRLRDLSQLDAEPEVIGKHEDRVFAVAFDQNSQMLASAGADRTIKLWRNLENRQQKPEILTGHKDGVSSVAFSLDGRWLASSSWSKDAAVRLWDLQHPDSTGKIVGKILWTHENLGTHIGESITSVAFSRDGKMLASGSNDKTIKLLDLRRTDGLSWDLIYEQSSSDSPENPVVDPMVLDGHNSRVWSVVFSPNSKMLASGSDDRTIRLWDLSQTQEEPQVREVLEGHNFWVGSVAFSPDGQKLASGSYDKTIRLWDLNHLDEEPIVLRGHEQSVTSVAFYPDSKKIVSGSYDNTMRSWITDTQTLADLVCKKVRRNLSQNEWEWFMGTDIPYEKTCPNLPPGEGILEGVAQEKEISKLEREFQDKYAQLKLYPGQKYVLEFIEQRAASQLDTAEEDITNALNKPKGDAGTFYRLETLRLLGFLEKTDEGHGHGTIRYGLSPRYREYLSKTKTNCSDPRRQPNA